jgi:hypothetical protein
VYKTICDIWVRFSLGYINKESAVCVFTKMWNELKMWGWNLKPSHIQWGHKEMENNQVK